MSHAKSDRGQFTFELLAYIGITPQEWRDLDQRDAVFLISAFNERNERLNNQHRQQMAKTRRR